MSKSVSSVQSHSHGFFCLVFCLLCCCLPTCYEHNVNSFVPSSKKIIRWCNPKLSLYCSNSKTQDHYHCQCRNTKRDTKKLYKNPIPRKIVSHKMIPRLRGRGRVRIYYIRTTPWKDDPTITWANGTILHRAVCTQFNANIFVH